MPTAARATLPFDADSRHPKIQQVAAAWQSRLETEVCCGVQCFQKISYAAMEKYLLNFEYVWESGVRGLPEFWGRTIVAVKQAQQVKRQCPEIC